MLYCRWNDWNLDHIAEHGIAPNDAEFVIENAQSPWPKKIKDEKLVVWGQAASGMYLQVIYVFSPRDAIYVIHARPLTENEKRLFRRRVK